MTDISEAISVQSRMSRLPKREPRPTYRPQTAAERKAVVAELVADIKLKFGPKGDT